MENKKIEKIMSIRDEISKLEEQKIELLRSISKKQQHLQRAINIENYNTRLLINSLEYLMSQKEKKNYKINQLELLVNLYSKQNIQNKYEYILSYITKNHNEEKALEEIMENYKITKSNNTFSTDLNSKEIYEKNLKPSENYSIIQLERNPNDISFSKLGIVFDEKFSYLNDYINYATTKKLDDDNLILNLYEMEHLADEFLQNEKNLKLENN